MSSNTILNAKVWPRIGLDHAPTKNLELLRNARYRAELATQFLLYDQVVLPTNDFGIVPVLVEWMGISTVFEALERNCLEFVRFDQGMGYAGNGNALSLFTVEPGKGKTFQWWQQAVFGPTPDALELQIRNNPLSIRPSDVRRLRDMVLERTTQFSMVNDEFMRQVVEESYQDIQKTPALTRELLRFYPDKAELGLTRLPDVGPDQMRVSGVETVNDAADLVLRVAEVNLEICIAVHARNADIYTSERMEDILTAKLVRSALGHTLRDAFVRLLELANVPDVEKAIEDSSLSFEELWRARCSKKAIGFRKWLRDASVEDASELAKAYVASLENIPKVKTFKAKCLRFILTAAAGVGSLPAGLAISAVDSFFLERWLHGYSPKFFIDEMRKLTIKDRTGSS